MKLPHIIVRIARKLLGPIVPKSARLPLHYWIFLLDGVIEPELRHIKALCKERGVAIDVGANIGLYSYRMARIFSKVYAFEINEGVAADLGAYNSKNIEIIHSGLSSEEGDLTLYIPVSKGIALHGWASLRPGNCPGTHEHLTKPVHVRRLDSFSIGGVSLLKIDVEGHELEVLRGAVETISASRPVVLVEVKDENVGPVASYFKALNYEETTLKAFCDVKGAGENRIYRPCA